MTQRILIEGGIARVIETRILSEAPLSALAPHMIQRVPTISPFQPEGTVITAYDPQNNRGTFVVQQKPRIVHMDMHFDAGPNGAPDEDHNRRGDDEHAMFDLAMPFLTFIYKFELIQPATPTTITGNDGAFTINDVLLYWHPKPLRSPTDKLWVAALPNVYADARICWGNTTADTASLATRIEDQTKNFFTNGFSSHLNLSNRRPAIYDSLTAWEIASKTDPTCWTDWTDWHNPEDTTLGTAAADFLGPIGQGPQGTIQLPPPPRVFGIGAARAWAHTLDPRGRRVIAAAIADELGLPRIEPVAQAPETPTATTTTPRLAGAARTRANRGTNA